MTRRQVFLNDREVSLDPAATPDVCEVEPGVFSVLLNGKSFEVRVSSAPAGLNLEILGYRFQAEVRDPRNSRHRNHSAIGGGRQNVTSPMPGKVVRVLVSEGQDVAVGQGLAVVEAMKMQNELKAPHAGKVAKVNVINGATVTAGEVILTIE